MYVRNSVGCDTSLNLCTYVVNDLLLQYLFLALHLLLLPPVIVNNQADPYSNNFENMLGIDKDALEAELDQHYGWQKR